METFYLTFLKPFKNITLLDEIKINNELSKIAQIKEDGKEIQLILILLSPGGDGSVAYKIVHNVRSHIDKLEIVVPLYAMSAGTLMCLGGDAVVMSPSSQLGPIDSQIQNPNRDDDDKVSALDTSHSVFQTFNRFKEYSHKLFNEYLGLVNGNRVQALRLAEEACANFFSPIISQIDPMIWSNSTRGLETAVEYGKILLSKYMLESLKKKMTKEKFETKIEGICRQLAYYYTSHDYAIMREEASKLGLNIVYSEEYTHWELVNSVYNQKFGKATNEARFALDEIRIYTEENFKKLTKIE